MKRCVVCGTSLGDSRSDRRTCSAKCRVALSRRLNEILTERIMQADPSQPCDRPAETDFERIAWLLKPKS